MNRRLLTTLLPLMFAALLAGCAKMSTLKFDYAGLSEYDSQGKAVTRNMNQDDLSARNQDIAKLEDRFQEVNAEASSVLENMRKKADTFSRVDLGIGLAGMAAGVAASALVVASPANAVWVAALSGTGAGAVGYQTSLAAEGMSRESVSLAYDDFTTEYKGITAAFGESIGQMRAQFNCTDEVWFPLVAQAMKQIYQLEALTNARPLHKGEASILEKQNEMYKATIDNMKELNESNKEFQKQMLQLIKK